MIKMMKINPIKTDAQKKKRFFEIIFFNSRNIFFFCVIIASVIISLFSVSCVGGYSFTGASINTETKTFYVENFLNRASIVQPMLSSELTYSLINKIRSGTSLTETEDDADAVFKGTITSYRVSPTAITATDQAAKNRLTISVKVKYTNKQDSKSNFEESFTRYKDYDASLSLSSVEEALIKEINEELVDDIFTKAFVNW